MYALKYQDSMFWAKNSTFEATVYLKKSTFNLITTRKEIFGTIEPLPTTYDQINDMKNF